MNGKVVVKKQAVKAVKTILAYCSTFKEDNENRENELAKYDNRPLGTKESKEKEEKVKQLKAHKELKPYFDDIEKRAKEIHSIMNKITYGSE